MPRNSSIYVEILIRAPMDALWEHTQTPELHEQWDLRFTRIEYLPRPDETQPQRFRYSTRIGFGLEIDGEGESVGQRDLSDGSRSSALKFSSAHTLSLISEGSGYWKYIPTSDGIRFLTRYDYHTRFGWLGNVVDRVAFRPLMGWATAWSFDRLRLWLERGVPPAQALRQAWIHTITRLALAAIFAYHGLVPKLLGPHPDEIAMLRDAGVAADNVAIAASALGVAELSFSIALIFFWRRRWPAVFSIALVTLATIGVAAFSPGYLGAAFNPVSLNLAVACLAAIDLLSLRDLPSADHCRRRSNISPK